MASFTSSNNNRTYTKIRFERDSSSNTQEHENKVDKQALWAKAKSYAHDRLWFEYVLPGLLESQGINTSKMNTSDMIQHISDIWDTKQYEINGQISVIMTFTKEDNLSQGYTGEHPSKWNKDTNERETIILNALATIGSNDFRYYVMNGDEWTQPLVPNDCFFGTYPLKYKGEIQKGKFRCVLKQKK